MANPNPSPATRFKPGNNANPGGKTSAQKKKERENRDMALELCRRMLSAMTEKVENGADPLSFLNADTLKLIKDSQDRADGTPKQTSEVVADLTHRNVTDLTDEELESIIKAGSGD